MPLVHPDLTNLEQFYIRTRSEVTAGRLHGQEGIARVVANTITDATGRVWSVDPMSPNPNGAQFKAGLPGQPAVVADPATYQPLGTGMSVAAMPYDGNTTLPTAVFPVDTPEKKARFKRDKSSSAVKSGSPLDRIKDLPRWVWLAGALAVVLMLVALQLLGTASSSTAPTTPPANTVVTDSSAPSTSTPDVATTIAAPPAGELSPARISYLISQIESLDASLAQFAVSAQIDNVAYAAFISKHQSGDRISATADPIELVGTPAASVTLHRVNSQGVEVSSATVMLVKDAVSSEWLFRDFPGL